MDVLGCRHGSEEVEIGPKEYGTLRVSERLVRGGGRGLGRSLAGRRVVLASVTVEVGGAVKLLPTEETLVSNITMYNRMPVKMVGAIESLTTILAEKLFCFWVRV